MKVPKSNPICPPEPPMEGMNLLNASNFQRKNLKLSAESTITPKTDLAIILALTPLGAIG
jgi:hypothetical protein